METNKQIEARSELSRRVTRLAQLVIAGAAFALLAACSNADNQLMNGAGGVNQQLPG